MNKYILRITIISVLGFLTIAANAQNLKAELSKHSGPYFGQTPPGLTPEVFAPGFISTDQFEFSATFSNDGKEFFFTRRKTYQGAENRIYSSQLIGDKWTTPELAPIAINAFEFEASITPDGKKMYFYSERNGKRNSNFDGDLWVSTKTDHGWSEAEYFLSPINKKWCMGVTSTLDGTLYFASNYDNQRGIFKCKETDGEYTEIEFLPEEINWTDGAHAFVAPDESYLIFDAQVSGMGKPELFISFKNEAGNWTMAINMGPEINATKTEFSASVTPDGKYMIFHRRVNGNGDLYWVSTGIFEELKAKALAQK